MVDSSREALPNKTLLLQSIEQVMAENCTGMDDHDTPDCYKCDAMTSALLKSVETWYGVVGQASRSAAIEEIISITERERASWPGEPCEAVRQGLTNVIKSLRALKGEG